MENVQDIFDQTLKKIDEFKLISTLRNLIKIPSYIGEEDEKADYVAHFLERLGLEVFENIIEPPKRRNVIAVLRGNGGGKNLMLTAHLDTLVPGEHVIFPPHEAIINKNKIYGVGLGDGSNASMASILGAVDTIVRSKLSLNGDLIVGATVDQLGHKEGGFTVVENHFHPDLCLVCEPSDFKIGVVHTGKIEVEITTKGAAPLMISPAAERAGMKHANAVVSMNKIMNMLQEMVKQEKYFHITHPLLPGEGAGLYFGPIIGGSWGYGDPQRRPGKRVQQHGLAGPSPTWCKLRIGVRYWPGQTSDEFMYILNKWMEKLKNDDTSIDVLVEPYLNNDNVPFEVSDNEVVTLLKPILQKVLGKQPKMVGIIGSTECSFYHKAEIPVAYCGATWNRFGAPDEHITINELLDSCRIYTGMIVEACIKSRK